MFEVVVSHERAAPGIFCVATLSDVPRVIRLSKGCRLEGKVIRMDGSSVPGADVQLLVAVDKYAAVADRYEVRAGAAGEFRFERVPPMQSVTIIASDGEAEPVQLSTTSGAAGQAVGVGSLELK